MPRDRDLYKVSTQMPPLPELEGKSKLSFFDQENADINLFNLIDDELIRISGSELLYFKFQQTHQDYDEVYLEVRTKPVTSAPIEVYGHYEPKPLEQNLTEFGLELTNDQLFVFNKSYISGKVGRDPIAGDIIKPKFQNQKYEIFEVQEDGFQIYGVYHMVCVAKLLRDEVQVVDEHLTKKTEDLGGYRDLDHV
tara:strand:+ start:2396 stop:2977 length:582 start_codon:yes stop_codon:yes gene_type:complete